MRLRAVAFRAILLAGLGFLAPAHAAAIPPSIAAAVADPGRPAADTARDAARKPAEVVAFAGIKAGDTVAELIPGGGYFTRVLSKVVGPTGKVYAIVPEALIKARPEAGAAIQKIAADPAYPNVELVTSSLADLKLPAPADVVWTSDNYHDMHNGSSDVATINKSILAALKPGGTYLIEDHAAAAGAGITETSTLHRIEASAAQAEVVAAGFTLSGESDVLKNPADPHTAKIFDPAIRGHTDQFVMKFKKPG